VTLDKQGERAVVLGGGMAGLLAARVLSDGYNEVIVVDREAVRLLAVSETNGIELRNCPAYIREWVAKGRVFGHDQ